MGLVVHVTLRSDFRRFPYEVPDHLGLETAEDVDKYLLSGRQIHGYRLWLDRPTTPPMIGLYDDPAYSYLPDRVRVLIRRDPWVLTDESVKHISPWIAGRVAEVVD